MIRNNQYPQSTPRSTEFLHFACVRAPHKRRFNACAELNNIPRPTVRKKFIIVIGSLVGLIASSTVLASTQPMLSHITNKITAIKNLINRDTNKRQQLQDDLGKTETSAGKITKHLTTTQKKLAEQQTLLNNLKRNERKYQEKLTVEQVLLNQQIQAAYMLGRQPYLKLMLNQENSSDISRILMYYRYINQNRIQTISDVQQTIKQIKTNQEEIQAQRKTSPTFLYSTWLRP